MVGHYRFAIAVLSIVVLLAGCGGGSAVDVTEDQIYSYSANNETPAPQSVNPDSGVPASGNPSDGIPATGDSSPGLPATPGPTTPVPVVNDPAPTTPVPAVNDPAGNSPGESFPAQLLPASFTDPTPGDPIIYEMIAGQHYLVGYVYITNDGTYITIELETIDDWEMSESHVYLGHDPPDTGAPGQFPIHADFDPWVTNYTFPPIPLADYNVEYKTLLYLAIHVSVHRPGQEETAWGGDWNDGDPSWDFDWSAYTDSNKWGGFMGTCLQPVPDLPDLPQEFTTIRFGTYSYWDVMFTDQNLVLPPGEFYIGDDKYYVGWCAEMTRWMYENHLYLAMLYSSYDPNLPADPLLPITMNGNLEFINYMINQRHNPTPGGPFDGIDWTIEANYLQLQDAIWYFTDGLILGTGSLAEAIADDAVNNGDNYVPCEGEWYSIILYPDTSQEDMELRPQMILIEVDP